MKAREKETTIMKRVSLMTKVPGLCVLGALGITFALSPLGAFAACGNNNQQKQVASIKSVEAFSSCSQRPISATQASKLAADGWATTATSANASKATVGDGATTAPAPAALTPAQLKNVSFLAGNASCSFSSVDPAAKTNLNDGDLFLGLLSSSNQGGNNGNQGGNNSNQAASKPIFGMIVNGRIVLFTGNQNGQHFANVEQNPNIKLGNATINQSNPGN
jgi:hypothetical protein